MNAPRWIDLFSYHRLVLAHGVIAVNVHPSYTPGVAGFRVCVNCKWLDEVFPTLEDAQQAGTDFARRLMADATHELNLLRMQTPVDLPGAELKVRQ